MPNIMTDEAEAIVVKLLRDSPKLPGRQRFRVDVKDGRSHKLVKVWYGNTHIGQYGIQRSSRPQRHNYVAEQLHLARKQAYDLAKCPLDVDEYITILEQKGEL